jgi:hypothetical protein
MAIPRSFITGKKHYHAGEYREAIINLRIALEHNLHFMPTYYFLGKSYLATHQFQLALTCLSEFFLSADEKEKCDEYFACLEESRHVSLTEKYLQDPLLLPEEKEVLLKIKEIQEQPHRMPSYKISMLWQKPTPPQNPKPSMMPTPKTTIS